MPYAPVDGTSIYYETAGSGPALVLVHGSGGNHAIWWQQVPYFAQRYQTITLDLRGFGNSDAVADGPDARDFPRDVLGVLDALHLEKAALLGQSIGALACLRLAVAQPARITAVVLAHSAGNMDDEELRRRTAADRAAAEELSVFDRLMSRSFQTRSRELTWLFQKLGTFNHANQQSIRNLQDKGPTPDAVNRAGVRVAFLAGEKDRVISPATLRKAQELVSGSMLIEVPNGPHSLYWENPAVFNCVVDQFLRGVFAL
jgi:pimeloyl-ACP methyl ester carboxylesterase